MNAPPRRLNSIIRFYYRLAVETCRKRTLDQIEAFAFDELAEAARRISKSTCSDLNDLRIKDAVKVIHQMVGYPDSALPTICTAGRTPEQAERIKADMTVRRAKRRAKTVSVLN